MAGKGWPSDVCGQNIPAKEAAGRPGGAELIRVRVHADVTSKVPGPRPHKREEKTISLQLRRKLISSRRAQDLAHTLKRSIWRSR